jgi:hypothetical protein
MKSHATTLATVNNRVPRTEGNPMGHSSRYSRFVNVALRVASLAAISGLLAGCISIPQRAWVNGEALSNSRAYQKVMAGDMSFATRRDLQTALNFGALGFYQEAPAFSPFPKSGSWR